MNIAGIGCRRDCPAEEILSLAARAATLAGPIGALAAPAFKRAEPGLAEAARRLGITLLLIDPPALQAAQGRCVTPSAAALRATGVAAVAEGCALAAAGPGGRLVLARIAGPRATCAIAVSPGKGRGA